MSSTVALTGLLPFVVLMASALAFPVSFLLLAMYRRAVRKRMASLGGNPSRPSVATVTPGEPVPPPRIEVVDPGSSEREVDAPMPAFGRAAYGPWHASAAYAFAGLAYASVMTLGLLLATGDEVIVWTKVLTLLSTYLWPTVLTILLVAAYDRRRRTQLLGGYFVAFAMLAGIVAARNPDVSIGSLPLFWVITNGPPTVLLGAFLIRPIRAVGPLVLALLLAMGFGSQSLVSVVAMNEGLMKGVVSIGFAIGLQATGVFIAMIIIGMLGFSMLGWPVLRLLGKRYEAKKFSDQSIAIDSLWLLFGVVQSIGFAFEGPLWILTGLVAFVAYKLVARGSLARAATRSTTPAPKTLLLLRVFALGKRSERLFDKLRKHWQYIGSISMIAGPDLVTTTIEPHEFLDFLSGRLDGQFIKDQGQLQDRTATLDSAPDPDGRYRVNEFFCYADSWQMTMEQLATMSDDPVLMDLRSFSAENQGCIFELGRLVDSVDFNRVVFLLDETTDRDFLESSLQGLWGAMSVESPNRSAVSPGIRLFRITRQTEHEIRVLLRLLLESERSPSSG